jgi:streptogramin lyase/tRNA A-37 threonylcarbamoyl transferase component Bud32
MTEIAGFEIDSEIGRGGMGAVYLAHQSAPRRRVALKVLRPELAADPAFRERFERESEAAASTEHPNIVPIYAAGRSNDVLYIAMRFVDGTDLGRLIDADGRLSTERTVAIVSQVAAALDAAHARGLVHRDVKPANVLLDAGGNAYLSDFGLIKRSEIDTGVTRTGQFMGSIESCAPEQIRGDEVGHRADVYSLGCLLYRCLTGSPPFPRDSEVATLYAHLEQPPPSATAVRPDLPAGIDRVIATAMAKRPDDRYGSAGELAADTRRALGVRTEGAPAPLPRRRLAVIVGAAVFAIAAALVGVLATRGNGPRARTGPPAGPPIGSVVRLDPSTGAVARTISGLTVNASRGHIVGFAAGQGGVWVGSPPVVEHVDPVTGSLRNTIVLRSYFLASLATGFRTVWVAGGTPNSIERINPATDALLRSVPLPSGGIVAPPVLALGEGGVWVGSGNVVYELGPNDARIQRRIRISNLGGIAAGEGSVWALDDIEGRLVRIDPATGKVAGSIEIPGNVDAVAAGGGVVWVVDEHAGTVTLVDPGSLSIQGTVRVGTDEQDAAFGAGALWLADGTGDSVTRVDPVTRTAKTFPIGSPVVRVAIDPNSGAVWALIGDLGGS